MRRKTVGQNILFLCEDNACRSQMAEAMARYLNPPKIRAYSAGLEPRAMLPLVGEVMAELGIALAGQTPKGVTAVPLDAIDLVVSFDDAATRCSQLPRQARVEFWSIPKPAAAGNESQALTEFRRCRDVIDRYVAALFLDHWRNVA